MLEKTKTIKRKITIFECIEYMIIYIMLYLSCGFAVSTNSGTFIMAAEAVCVIIVVLNRFLTGRHVKVTQKSILYVVGIAGLIILGEVLRGGSFKHVQIGVYGMLMAYVFAMCFSFEEYMKKISNIMYFLCVYSLVLYVAFCLTPELVKKLPTVENTAGWHAYHAGFSTIYKNVDIRNQGIFWEPGAFQTFINLALITELFYFKTFRKRRVFIYLITIFTTFSTAGFITAFVLIYIFLLQSIINKKARKRENAMLMLYVMTILVLLFFVFQNIDTPLTREVFGKLDRYFDGGVNTGTVDVRMSSFIEPLKALLQNPTWGLGYVGSKQLAYAKKYYMDTCTFVNWLSYYGIIVGTLIISLYYKLAKKMTNSRAIGILVFVALFLTTFSENYARNDFFLSIGFVALSCPKKEGVIHENRIN